MHRDSLISFISFIKDLYIFQAKPRQILSCAWLLGARSDVLLCSSNPDLKPPPSPSRACTRFPELEIRHQAHRAASGTNKWKENEAAANIAPAARSVPGVPSAQVLGAPSNNIRSAIRGSLCLNYIKKKKKLMSSEHFTCCSPLSRCSLGSWNRLPFLASHAARSP